MSQRLLIVGTSILLTAVLIAAAWLTGPHIDEYWTIQFTDPSVPLRSAFAYWSQDTGHPPLFYAAVYEIARLFDGSFADNIFARRLLNLAPVAAYGVAAWCYSRRPDDGYAVAGIAMLTVGSAYMIERFGQHRAPFLALLMLATLILVARRIFTGRPRRTDIFVATLLSAALALTDYPAALAGLAFLAATSLCLLINGSRSFWITSVAAAALLLGLGACLLNASRYPLVPSPYHATMGTFFFDMGVVLASAVTPALPLLFSARKAVLMKFPGLSIRVRRPHSRITFDRCLVLTLVICLVGFSLLNVLTHVLIRRQLLPLVPLVAAMIVELCRPLDARRLFLVELGVLASAAPVLVWLSAKKNMETFAPQIIAAQKACPATPVYAVDPREITSNPEPPAFVEQARKALARGYADVAQRYRFNITPAGRGDRQVDGQCGALVWIEHFWPDAQWSPSGVARLAGLDPTGHVTASHREGRLLLKIAPGSGTIRGG